MAKFALLSEQETRRFGLALGERLRPGDVVGLVGDLGTGKTTLTQAIAHGMGIGAPVTSPTFALIHEYRGPIPLFHIDPYRLERPEEMEDLGFDEYFERGGVVIVEWADRVAELLPPERLTLTLKMLEAPPDAALDAEAPRLLTAEATGKRYENLLAELAALPPLKALGKAAAP
jgi:tRNA threonylcarbamoyladenosine biosynthesis protein TsaE